MIMAGLALIGRPRPLHIEKALQVARLEPETENPALRGICRHLRAEKNPAGPAVLILPRYTGT